MGVKLHFQTQLCIRLLLRTAQTLEISGALIMFVATYLEVPFPHFALGVSYLAVDMAVTNFIGPMESLAYNSRQVRQLMMGVDIVCIGIVSKVLYEFNKTHSYIRTAYKLGAAQARYLYCFKAIQVLLWVYFSIEFALLFLHIIEFPAFLKSKHNIRDNRLFDKSLKYEDIKEENWLNKFH